MLSVAIGFATPQHISIALRRGAATALLLLTISLIIAAGAHAQTSQRPKDEFCGKTKAILETKAINFPINGGMSEESQPNLIVDGTCTVNPGADYYYGKVNIINGGTLIFKEGNDEFNKVTNFWAQSIIVENNGTLQAGEPNAPFGTTKTGNTLNIVLYGKDRSDGNPLTKAGDAETCYSDYCGVDSTLFTSNGDQERTFDSNGIKDYFYTYGAAYGTRTTDPKKGGYFGYKVLGLGYGGTLKLYGKKGATGGVAADSLTATQEKNQWTDKGWTRSDAQTETGTSWLRLSGDLANGGTKLTVDSNPKVVKKLAEDWQVGDKIVVTTTDYLPNHSEELTIAGINGNEITVTKGAAWYHRGTKFNVEKLLSDDAKNRFTLAKMDPDLQKSAETRAAVALLTRSIRIVSGGDYAGDYFECPRGFIPKELTRDKTKDIAIPTYTDTDGVTKWPLCATARYKDKKFVEKYKIANTDYYFGGHTSFRQGFKQLQLQGVEFRQMGQGGRMSHYPVHFHMARQVPAGTYIKDSSVNESMTRWFVLHSTLGVTLQRNVGWKSIGHGFYLEDGTETDNKFYANIGIFARGGVVSPDNDRNVPGIIAQNGSAPALRYRSDVIYPTVFWITNGWNDFVGNMAAGAGTCGMCYWFLPNSRSDRTDYPDHHHSMTPLKWKGYAGRQTLGHEGETPVRLFYKNYCTTAMHSLNTSDGVTDCLGVRPGGQGDTDQIAPVTSVAPVPVPYPDSLTYKESYYPMITAGNRKPTVCPDGTTTSCDLANLNNTCGSEDPKSCGITIIDHYTSSFNWAATNFSAVWLRTPGWFLFDNSFLSDVQSGGLTMVSGGDYSRASTFLGYWALASRSIFVGATQGAKPGDPGYNPFADPRGPREEKSGAKTEDLKIGCTRTAGDRCINKQATVYYPLTPWGTGQRLFNIYDGPAHQDANAYLNIKTSDCNGVDKCMYYGTAGVRRYLGKEAGYLPNAAIGWKQPNGFYYPPAFHSKNLYFKDVDIRHYVIQPLYTPGTYLTDDARVTREFVGIGAGATGLMTGFTDIDRQTELTDDDGTLTGFMATNDGKPQGTISVNEDGFFSAWLQAPQCKSNAGINPDSACAKTSVPTPQTARTSPYDYITTVIYPHCAMDPANGGDGKGQGDCGTVVGDTPLNYDPWDKAKKKENNQDVIYRILGERFDKKDGRGGSWSAECASSYCFGIPIYRQYLTGTKAAENREWATWSARGCDDPQKAKTANCNFPFARMSGAKQWQRNIMTVNYGKYYIDTTRSEKTQKETDDLGAKTDWKYNYVECGVKEAQKLDPNKLPDEINCQPRSLNIFKEGETYFVFFLFAKADTKQIYQIYVGDNFDPTNKNQFSGVKITYTDGHFKYEDSDHQWKAELISADPKGQPQKKDVLQVTVDFSKIPKVGSMDVKTLFDPNPKSAVNNQTCKPISFCTWKGSQNCACALDKNDPRVLVNPDLIDICNKTCGEWAVKDLDGVALNPDDKNGFRTARYGFRFKLPAGFRAQDQYKRPQPTDISNDTDITDPIARKQFSDGWSKIVFNPVDQKLAGDCAYDAKTTVPITDTTDNKKCVVRDCTLLNDKDPPLCQSK